MSNARRTLTVEQALLWMEPEHPIVIARLAGVFLCALPAARELYQYVGDPRCVVVRLTLLYSYSTFPSASSSHSMFLPVCRTKLTFGILSLLHTQCTAVTRYATPFPSQHAGQPTI